MFLKWNTYERAQHNLDIYNIFNWRIGEYKLFVHKDKTVFFIVTNTRNCALSF